MSKQLETLDANKGDTFKNASKEAWECTSYHEFLMSLPEEELPVYEQE